VVDCGWKSLRWQSGTAVQHQHMALPAWFSCSKCVPWAAAGKCLPERDGGMAGAAVHWLTAVQHVKGSGLAHRPRHQLAWYYLALRTFVPVSSLRSCSNPSLQVVALFPLSPRTICRAAIQ
jgi:hypothetical protein